MKRNICIATVLVLLGCAYGKPDPGQYCYSTDPDPFRLYATKTAYETVRGTDADEDNIPGCRPIGLWLLARHGTRHTGTDDVMDMEEIFPVIRDDINEAQENGQSNLCSEDVAGLNLWDSPMPNDQDKTLGEEGWREFRGIGSRFKQRYPSLLDLPYDSSLFDFRYTDHTSNRTRDTARALAEGIFGTYENIEMSPSAQPDTLLRFYDFCPRYDQEVGDHDIEEYEAFLAGPEMADVRTDMARRCGLSADYFTHDMVDLLFESCRVEYGLYGEAPWCAVFSEENLKVIEYSEDIKYYWEDSYPHDISWEMSCELTKDFMTYFNIQKDNEGGPNLVSRYGHSQTLNAFFTSLGLWEPEEHLRADNYEDQQERSFRVSGHTPMGSNIMLSLYDCDGEDHRVKVWVNEHPVVIPGCPVDESLSCAFQDFARLFQPTADSCDFDSICAV